MGMPAARSSGPGSREPRLRPIFKPGTPRWARHAVQTEKLGFGTQFAMVSGFVALILFLVWLGTVSLLAMIALTGGLVATAGLMWSRATPKMVLPPWLFEGVPIRGQAFALLEDIDRRFAYAQRMIHEVPTGLDWSEIEKDVEALMWETAEHAARVSELDVEIHEFRYAAEGTPAAAFTKSLEARRDDHLNLLVNTQYEADALASVAGNAAAAARLALRRTGSLAALEVVSPTAHGVAARGALRDARERLAMLAEVWSHLDESNTALAEKTDADFANSDPIREPPRGRSQPPR